MKCPTSVLQRNPILRFNIGEVPCKNDDIKKVSVMPALPRACGVSFKNWKYAVEPDMTLFLFAERIPRGPSENQQSPQVSNEIPKEFNITFLIETKDITRNCLRTVKVPISELFTPRERESLKRKIEGLSLTRGKKIKKEC
jgi:hypothetical protein